MPLLPPLSGTGGPPRASGERLRLVRDPLLSALEQGSRPSVGLLAAAAAFVVDQATKHLAVNLLQPPGRRVEVPGPFSLQLTFNPGGAFGISMPTWFFLLVTIVVVVVVVRNLPSVPTDGQAVAYGLLLAGALGNAADRVFRDGRRVVDFIASARWPTFNVADIAITSGFALLLLLLYLQERREHERREQERRTDHERQVEQARRMGGAEQAAPRDG